jgi:sensor histidine kinase YesM
MKAVKLKHFLLNKSIFSKILLSYLLVIILPVTLIGFFSFKASEQIISQQISLLNSNTINQVAKNIGFLLDQVIAVVNVCNQNSELETDFNKRQADPYLRLKNSQKIQAKIQNYSYALGWMKYQMILIGANGDIYAIPDGISRITPVNIARHGWYPQMLQDPERILWLSTRPSFLKGDDDKYFTAIKPLQNGYSKNHYGILLLSIAESNLYDIYQDSLNNGNQMMIIDSRGRIISHAKREKVGEISSERRQLLKLVRNKSQNRQIIALHHGKYIFNYKQVAGTDWYIINIIPLTAFSKDIYALGLKILLLSLGSILLALAAALFISRKIAMPLINLSARIKNRHRSEAAAAKSSFMDEMDIVSKEYDHIVGELEKTINNLVKEQEEKRKVELQALQAQINPHFLYNTLNSIKCLVWTGQVELIEPTINALVNLLEQTIGGKDDELIRLEDELNNIRSYMYIQNIRLHCEIQLLFKVPQDLSQYKIPKLLLQPIIENAVFHGIEPKNKPGRIYIYCTENDSALKIEVLDDGIGMDRETIANIFSGKHHISNRFSGIGLKNVDERLKLYFGSQFGLAIESEVGVGTSVVLMLPKSDKS